MRNPFVRKADAETPPVETDQRETQETPLRDTLRAKLKELIEAGDVSAMRLGIDHPELLKEPEVEPQKTVEELRASIRQFLLQIRDREIADDPQFWQHAFERVIADRLEHEAKTTLLHVEREPKLALLRRWQALNRETKADLWKTILECLEEGGADELLAKAEETVH